MDMSNAGGRSRVNEIANAALRVSASGVLGAPAMEAASKLVTGRPDSFALVTGVLADAFIAPSATSSARRRDLRRRKKGFA
jgi:hypothetical protein